MRVLSACKYLKSGCRLCADAVVGKHSLNCKLHCELGLGCHKGLVLYFLKTTDVAGVTAVVLLLKLSTGENCFFCIDDDNEFTAINVGGELRTVLTAKNGSCCYSGSAERLACCIDVPKSLPVKQPKFIILGVIAWLECKCPFQK